MRFSKARQVAKEQYDFLDALIPITLRHQASKIHHEVDFWLKKHWAANIKPAEKRCTEVINGPSQSGKSKWTKFPLAQLIMNHMESQNLIQSGNYKISTAKSFHQPLPKDSINGYEAICWEEFSVEHFKLSTFAALSSPYADDLKVM